MPPAAKLPGTCRVDLEWRCRLSLTGRRVGPPPARQRAALTERRVGPPPARRRASPSRRLPLKGGVTLEPCIRPSHHSPLEGESQKPSRMAKASAVGGQRRGRSRGRPQPEAVGGRKPLTLLSGRCYDFAIGPKVLESEPKGKRVQFPHGRATVISEFAGEAGHCCFRQWEGSRSGVQAVSQETCLGIDEARCARERLGRTCTQIFRTAHPGISLPSAFQSQPCLPMKTRDPRPASRVNDYVPLDAL